MATSKIKKGDLVRVIAGKDKDKEGKVLSVNKKIIQYSLKVSTWLQSIQNLVHRTRTAE